MRALNTVLTIVLASIPAMAATTCESLASLSFPDATITSAQSVAAGAFTPPQIPMDARPRPRRESIQGPPRLLPRHRDPQALQRLRHQDRSLAARRRLEPKISGRRQRRLGRRHQLFRLWPKRCATATPPVPPTPATSAAAAAFALGHPGKADRFRLAIRARNDLEIESPSSPAFYGNGARLSYWNGCSTGGRQGLKEAQKFPADYDGIIAGAPANRTALAYVDRVCRVERSGRYIPPAKYPADPSGGASINAMRADGRERRSHRRSHPMQVRSRR